MLEAVNLFSSYFTLNFYLFCFLYIFSQIRTLKKRDSEEVCGRFPAKDMIRGNEELNVRLENLPNIELQEEVKRLNSLLEEAKTVIISPIGQ